MKLIYTGIKGKSIVLCVTGGIAAYKSAELLRLMIKQGADVRVMMTANAGEFVGPVTFEALSGQNVCTDLFQKNEGGITHIEWAAESEAVIIAPATANLIGKFANGIADDAVSTFLLVVTCPVLICPAMNTNMYQNKSVQRNLQKLADDGHIIVAPGEGDLACGTTGPGRLPEPSVILDRLIWALTPKDFSGKRILVTAGPTHESIDPVRFITNPSSGKMGYAIARAAENRGAQVTLVSGPTHLHDPIDVDTVRVRSAQEMAEAVLENMENFDIIIKSAAVSDYRPKNPAEHKIKKGADESIVYLDKTIDILKELGRRKKSCQMLIGFAAETQELEKNASKKLAEKNLDMIVGNLVNAADSGFAVDTNKVTFFFKDGTNEHLDIMEKDMLAHVLLNRIQERIMS